MNHQFYIIIKKALKILKNDAEQNIINRIPIGRTRAWL